MRKKKLIDWILKILDALNRSLIDHAKLLHNIENDQWIHDKFFEMIDRNKKMYNEVEQWFKERI